MKSLAFIAFAVLLAVSSSFGQAGTSGATYAHIDSFKVTVGETLDVTFTTVYQQASLKFIGSGGAWIILGAPDTTNWATRTEWLFIAEGEVINLGTLTKLRKVRIKPATTTGTLYIIGTKKAAQWGALIPSTMIYDTFAREEEVWHAVVSD